MKYRSLREFLSVLEQKNYLKKIKFPIDPYLEMTEISYRTLRSNGPALLFEQPKGYSMPVLCNLFGTSERILLSITQKNISSLKEIGQLLAFLKDPKLSNSSLRDLLMKIPKFQKILNMPVKRVNSAVCQEEILTGEDIDLNCIPIMHCWPEDVAPLITWGITITRDIYTHRQNLGIYRHQVLSKNKIIMRWLPQRGGALDFKKWMSLNRAKNFPIAIVIGADPATLLSAATPIPNSMSEYSFSGLLRGCRTEVVKCITSDLEIPANSEIVLEGYIKYGETAEEGPYGDHTGYYNSIDIFPVCTVTHITKRHNAFYHSTYTGHPPDEPSILGSALNEIFIPILQQQFPEITDFYLPPESCSYRMAIVTIKKSFLGHAKIIMMGIWSFIYQFMYVKFIIVCDDDIDARDWKDVMWAISTRVDPKRDTFIINNTPIDYLDFSSPISGLGSKIGIDATNKWPNETQRLWGQRIEMSKNVQIYIDKIWNELSIFKKQ